MAKKKRGSSAAAAGFLELLTHDERTCYVRPSSITFVEEAKRGGCRVHLDTGVTVNVTAELDELAAAVGVEPVEEA